MDILNSHKFKLGDKVHYGNTAGTWFVTGINLHIGYDLYLWQYNITKATYGDYPLSSLFCRCDVNIVAKLREEQLVTEQEYIAYNLKLKNDEITSLREKLKQLEEESL